MPELHPIHQAYADALAKGAPVRIEIGRDVLCDIDDTDLTDDPRSGGYMFGSYAVGPCCAEQHEARVRGYGEQHFITARCPEDMSFADWVRAIRAATGNNAITITPGHPGAIR